MAEKLLREQRAAFVASALQRKQQILEQWSYDPNQPFNWQDLPLSIVNALCIPDTLTAQLAHPENMRVVFEEANEHALRALVVTAQPERIITDAHATTKYYQQLDRWAEGARSGKIFELPHQKRLDPLLVYSSNLLRRLSSKPVEDQRTLSVHDLPLLEIELTFDSKNQLIQANHYYDREEFRGNGSATEFMLTLQAFARKLGLEYITANNNEDNIAFFTSIGAIAVSSMPEKERQQWLYVINGSGNYSIVFFLNGHNQEPRGI